MVNCLESLRFSPKSVRTLGVVVSVILKILIRFGNNYAFYFEIFEKNNGYFLHYVDGSIVFGMLASGTEFLEIIKLILSCVLDV